MIVELIAAASFGTWLYLFTARGNFWHIAPEPTPRQAAPARVVCAIIPARNEEAVIGQALESLTRQQYQGTLHIIVVDDHSSDRTAEIAAQRGVTVIPAEPLPPGWSGKLWAIDQGLRHAASLAPDYFLFTDADIVHGPANVSELVVRAEAAKLDLVSYMVKLRCRSLAETLMIPAFVFFFFMLYPPAWVRRRSRRTAAAAGGCILIRATALERVGGIAGIRGEIIDDCALARAVKRGGGMIWLGVTDETSSIRDYKSFADIRAMISRTAFAQLHHSTLLLIGTIAGMAIVYLAPPLLLLSHSFIGAFCGLAGWLLMMVSYSNALRFYRRSVFWAPLLPLIALFYISATVDSAIAYWSGRGGLWKERVQDQSTRQ